MSIRGTIIGEITKKAKINWDNMSEKEADEEIEKIKDYNQAIDNVTYGSERVAMNGIAKVSDLTDDEFEILLNDVYTKKEVSSNVSNKVLSSFNEQGNEKAILKVLTYIHDEWVKNNGKKFGARNKDYQFVNINLLSFEEVEKDLIFLQAILEGCGLAINIESLKKEFLSEQKEFLRKNEIISHEKLVKKIMSGSSFYPTLEGVKDSQNRMITQNLNDYDVADKMAKQVEEQIIRTKTDLHTHLNGVLPTEQLIELLEKCGIDTKGVTEEETTLKRDRVETFSKMNDLYRNRNRITKKMLENGKGKEFLQAVAEAYAKSGIEYVELTTDAIMLTFIKNNPSIIEEIEQETGVKLRFLLGAIHRSDSEEKNIEKFLNEETQNLLKNSKYIKGIDLYGNEGHGTELNEIKNLLNYLAEYGLKNDDFVIRIHSGENETDKDGIKNALKAIKSFCKGEELYNKDGSQKYPKIRIGHTIHGMLEKNEETVKLMKELGVSVELNLASNVVLGNIKNGEDADAKRAIELCQKYEIPIFLGTDGFGIYGSSPEEQVKLAQEYGCNLFKISKNEEQYIEKIVEQEKASKPRVSTEREDTDKSCRNRLMAKLERIGVKILNSQTDKEIKEKIPITVAGGSLKTRAEGNIEDYKKIELMFQTLTDVLDSKKVYIVTGGTDCGPERFVHRAVNITNKERNEKNKLICIGAMIKFLGKMSVRAKEFAFPIDDLKKVKRNTITHALLLDKNTMGGWDSFPRPLLEIANNKYRDANGKKGCMIFVGGGETVRQEIRIAIYGEKEIEAVPTFLYNGFGASREALERINKDEFKNVYEFSDVESLIKSLYSQYGKTIFSKEFDINKLGEYVRLAKRNIEFDYNIVENTLIEEGKYSEDDFVAIKQALELSEDNMYRKLILKQYEKNIDMQLFIKGYIKAQSKQQPKEIPDEVFEAEQKQKIEEKNESIEK